MRRPANPAPTTPLTNDERGVVTLERTLRVITPLFGGGVRVDPREDHRHQKEPDCVTPIRSAAIRGQLRFWWRATHGSACGSIAVMKEREAELWGAASKPGKVRLAVELCVEQKAIQLIRREIPRALAYGAFPLRPPQGAPGWLHDVRGAFMVKVGAPIAFCGEVQDALDAWICFGGIGGRTRRGFGALAGDTPQDPRTLFDRLTRVARPMPGLPSLAGARLEVMCRTRPQAFEAQGDGLQLLRDFRQGDDLGRNQGQEPNRPGRSRWPEPDEIRRLTNSRSQRHQEVLTRVRKFPRAAFGLPIIFHFKDQQDPSDTRLVPQGAERLASPLILRPFQMPAGGYGLLALVLGDPTRLRAGSTLIQGTKKFSAETALTPAEAESILPLRGLGHDILDAFLNHLRG